MIVSRKLALIVTAWLVGATMAAGDEPRLATRNVILVTTDGFRWQEVFRGAEESLLNKPDGGVADVEGLRSAFWRDTPEARREALMPFLWTVVAKRGQIYGNADKGSSARVANGKNFSYPGYNELFTGFADPRIDSNDKIPNPNVSVFEWLNRKGPFQGRVAAFGSWDVYPFILNRERSQLPVIAGWEPLAGSDLSPEERALGRIVAGTHRIWDGNTYDSFTYYPALEYLKRRTPRVLYIGLGETDEFAHEGRYDAYLKSAHRVDGMLRDLWETLQSLPQYRGTTTLIVTTDHGRGDPPIEWRSHGEKVKGSESIWIAVLGPDTPALGERTNCEPVTQGQVAATIAALFGEDYLADAKAAAKPLTGAITPGAHAAVAADAASPLRRIAFGSCANQERPQPIWDAIRAVHPELFLLLGDNIYADTVNMDVMKRKYAKLAAIPGFQKLRQDCPFLATWDDHDLGVNDGGSDYPKKVESQQLFLDFFGDPADSPRRHRPGVYDARTFGPDGKRVQAIMLDTRYFRSSPLTRKRAFLRNEGPYQANPDAATTILGETQWAWLADQLRQPAELRILVSSIQVVAEDHGWEKWMNFPHERERLFRLIRDTGVDGLIILSGDRHLAELSTMDAGVGYPVYDLTSSGLNMAFKIWRPQEPNRHRVATMNRGDNFGVITIDWDLPDPLISLQIRDDRGDVRIEEQIKMSYIRKKPAPAR